jgi:fluoroacetyl-CoA thioesterase
MSQTSAAGEVLLPSPGQDFPAVLLVELMERAAARQMRRELSPGESSMATMMNLRHAAVIRSSRGHWRVEARRRAVRGRFHDFDIDVFDDSGWIACAEHTRAVVNERRLLAIARRRAGRPALLLQV